MIASPPTLRIVHALLPSEVGGLESVVAALARGQRDRGHDVTVAAIIDSRRPEPALPSRLEREGVRVARIPYQGKALLRERRLVADVCRRHRADVLHTHGVRPDVVCASLARRLGIRGVSTAHGTTGGSLKWRLYERLHHLALRGQHVVVAVSRPLRELLAHHGVPRANLRTIVNAAPRRAAATCSKDEARRALGIGIDAVHLGWIGRLSAEKGADVFLEALAHLTDRRITSSIVGDGPERGGLEQQARRLGIADRVRFHGTVAGAGDLLIAFDLFVLSSRTEGTPIVLFEAMDAGVPVVATRVGGVPDVVSSTEAWLVDPEHPQALGAAIEGALRDADARAARVLAAQRRLSEFDPGRWLDAYDALYRAHS